ncbi:hypothetical protein HAX54_053154 [Datura stramonium]|uniref:Uncharacterized protein n=1 Tax=Datura stramonium TaxID=4076 RepID=A0ABS8WT93_DATST|nr:hypothetical protein [Datura stramonium]
MLGGRGGSVSRRKNEATRGESNSGSEEENEERDNDNQGRLVMARRKMKRKAWSLRVADLVLLWLNDDGRFLPVRGEWRREKSGGGSRLRKSRWCYLGGVVGEEK